MVGPLEVLRSVPEPSGNEKEGWELGSGSSEWSESRGLNHSSSRPVTHFQLKIYLLVKKITLMWSMLYTLYEYDLLLSNR